MHIRIQTSRITRFIKTPPLIVRRFAPPKVYPLKGAATNVTPFIILQFTQKYKWCWIEEGQELLFLKFYGILIAKGETMENEYTKIFEDANKPNFIEKYLQTKSLTRLKDVTQFCGCDYTKLYQPRFLYTRYDHSMVVARMTWHFTHDKKQTIVALLHDIGTPCFAQCIDYVFGDYIKQESAEKKITEMVKQDEEILAYLVEDGLSIKDLENLEQYPILENNSPKLCTDRLDGVLHTCYIWLRTHSLEQICEVWEDMCVLTNEEGKQEIGFSSPKVAEKFSEMVQTYAKELQGNTDKYVSKYVSEIVKTSFQKNLLTLEDLYTKKETELVGIFEKNFTSWKNFETAEMLTRTNEEPHHFCISYQTKKRSTIPLVRTELGDKRITNLSQQSEKIYADLASFQDTQFAYIPTIPKCE